MFFAPYKIFPWLISTFAPTGAVNPFRVSMVPLFVLLFSLQKYE
jgi:hypothetical protein